MYFRTLLFFAFSAFFFFPSCDKDNLSSEERLEMEKQTIRAYLTEKGLTAEETEDDLFFISDIEGSGANPTADNTVTVHYEGFLLDGTKFDSSRDRNMTSQFGLRQVIRGWTLGIPLLKKGGRGRLIIPSSLAYGSNPPQGIPSNAILLFDVELIDFQ